MSATIQSIGISPRDLPTIGDVISSIEHGSGVIVSVEGDKGPFFATLVRLGDRRERVEVRIFRDATPTVSKVWGYSFPLSALDPLGIFRIAKVVLEEFSGVPIDSQ